jgi:cytochrome c oxidase assembly factor CtaG
MPYHGPPELTLTGVLTRWTLDPWVLALVLVLGGGYLAAMRRVRRADPGAGGLGEGGQREAVAWPAARPIWFLGLGLGPLVLATMSWVGVYQSVLFYARAAQTVLLVLVVPLFLALGRPLTLVIAAFPGPARRIEAAIRSRPAKVLTFPAVTTFALVIVPFVMYFSPWYTAAFHSTAVRELTYLALMTPGFAFFWTLLRVDPVPKAYSYAVSMWITGAEVIGDAVLGLAIIADNGLIGAAWYHGVARPWGPTLRTDQVIGGGVLWVLGDVVGLPFLAAQLIQFMREDESQAVKIDAELDARDAENAAGAVASVPAAAEVPGVADTPAARPWWEADSRFTDRFKPADP